MNLLRASFLVLALGGLASCNNGSSATSTSTGATGAGTTSGGGGASTTSTTTVATGASTTSTGGADPCTTALFCDDFESYPLGAPPAGKWTNNQNGGSVSIDSTHVHSGTKAVKVTANMASGYRSAMISLAGQGILPVNGDVVYGRMMFWLDSAPTGTVHWTFIDGSGPVPTTNYHAVYRYGGQLPIMNGSTFVGSQLMANYDTPDSYGSPPVGPSSDCWLHSNKEVVPVAKWTCVQWMFDTTHNTMRFWQDGTELTDLAMTGTGQGCVHQPATFQWLAPKVERLDLGWESYQADGARNIWIDDVGVDDKPIACPQ
jgi:hypothetical protein